MSEQQQRIELWASVNKGCVQAYYRDHDLAMRMRHPDEQIVRLVEIREGETHPDEAAKTIKETNELVDKYVEGIRAMWALLPEELIVQGASVVDQMRKHIASLTERAEKAEKAWRYLVKTIDDANTNERARYERETAARLLAAEYGAPDDEISFENAIEVESYWQRRAMWAKRTASVLADACFGAKEAKG